ncbi:hypothetical protein [Paraglaciecola chathamensis]|uniref:Uncharacterized protein n=1 Tax=Paraglaciecola chathamensis TaxID=368405 RepID=A0A8H9IB00_9ALTE|nr:hypothetical protein [Paraglaciecola oceanifecundans]AEE23269.1 hypothetical protein Glaag_2324 [Glaciecola sp. 4H-3-7+YE-5]GGZ68597.1 hypothetical protein GCM10011274_29020 [Paraglaciecola oceanifecundans]
MGLKNVYHIVSRSAVPLVAGIALSVFSTSIIHAQQMGNPLDFVNSQLAEQMKNQVRAMSDPDLIKAQAQLQRRYYEALIEAGFSKEEAFKIILATAQGKGN